VKDGVPYAIDYLNRRRTSNAIGSAITTSSWCSTACRRWVIDRALNRVPAGTPLAALEALLGVRSAGRLRRPARAWN